MNRDPGLLVAWPTLLLFDTASQLAFKLGSRALDGKAGAAWGAALLTSPWIIAGVLGYLGSFAAWMLILRRAPLSQAFPMTAIGYIAVVLASHLLLGEIVDAWRWVGIGCIATGFGLMIGDPADCQGEKP